MPQIVPGSIIYFVTYRGETCGPFSRLISFSRQKEKDNHSEEVSTDPEIHFASGRQSSVFVKAGEVGDIEMVEHRDRPAQVTLKECGYPYLSHGPNS